MTGERRGVDVSRSGAGVIRPEMMTCRSLRNDRGEVLEIVGPAQGSSMDVHINTIRAGAGPGPYHAHLNAQNFFLVLEGSVRFRIAGKDAVARPGDAVFIPRGVPHSVSVLDDGTARLIEIYEPAPPDFTIVEETEGEQS